MAKIQNSFLKGKMNKELDERLVPKGEYREAQNILITQSEGSDVGAIENILGNALSRTDVFSHLKIEGLETIGHYADVLDKRVFWFVTNFTGNTNDIRTMSRASVMDTCMILMVDLSNDASNITTLVSGSFLNFSKDHLITGVNLIDDLLFWTDDYNQPRKINVTKAIADQYYYTKEEQISVAKVVPYLAPILHDNDGNGDETTLTNDEDNITSDYLKDRFVRFSYRYKYEDGEYTTMAPFTQIVFKPLNNGQIDNVLNSAMDTTDVQDVYSKTIVDIMKNDYNKVELRIPLPSYEEIISPPDSANGYGWDNELRIEKIEILIKESDQDVVKVIKEIDVTDSSGNSLTSFLNNIETYTLSPDQTYHRYAYKFTYKSEEPYKILEDKQITRVFDQVPLRAKAQEISGNRVIYGNFTENYNLPTDSNGKTGINYVINNITKGDIERIQEDSYIRYENNKNTYKYNSLKQRRKYQVGIILADKFGRQSPVILSTDESDTITTSNISEDLSNNYLSSYSWSSNHLTIGKGLSVKFQDNNITDNVYNGDINDTNYNPYGWYSWKIVVKQKEQEYYNVYTSHPADNWNNESNSHDDVLGYTWISLYGDNINKIPRDVGETGDIRENVAGSDVKLFPKVIMDKNQFGNNLSTFGRDDQDPIEVMTVGTAREQGILTKGDRDKDRVHDFVMSKRNPLLAQLKSLGINTGITPNEPITNNRVDYKIDVDVIENNLDDRSYFTIGDGNDINPYIREGQEVTLRITNRDQKYKTNLGKKVFDVRVDHDEQRDWDSKTIILDGDEIGEIGGSARIEVGQIIEYRSVGAGIYGTQTTVTVGSHTGGNNYFTVTSINAELQGMILDADQEMDLTGEYTPILITGTGVPVGTYIDISQTASSIQGGVTPPVIYLEGSGTLYSTEIEGSLTVGDAGAITGGIDKTTATIEEHGPDNADGSVNFVVRRPILQKVELNKDETRTILHFDRRVFPNNSVDPVEDGNELLALYDPLLIKSVETITKVESGQTKYYQKIKLDHEVALGLGTDMVPSDLVIQNLESEPIAVDRGLTVLETNPVESNLDIYYETSTSGLVKDLNSYTPIHGTDKEIEISYFNTFILAGGGDHETNIPGKWHVEESRIKGGFNDKSVDFGVRAHLVDDEYAQRVRGNALIYSGIFNAKTKVNETNQFSIGENITKAVDIQNGSIQKLYAEDTNLIVFQENKVNRALIDKDAIFTAEGTPLTTSSKVVIGQVVSFAGKYGISRNPESFAVYGGRKYFADKNRGLILRLSSGTDGGDGITPISNAGMRSFFRDNLYISNRIYGMYDEQKNKYIVSLQSLKATMDRANKYGSSATEITSTNDLYTTLSFDEASKGWVSFYTYKPTFGFSISNKFYTFNEHLLYEHYREDVQRCKFYTSDYTDPAEIEFVLNDQPNIIKNFLTIDYEGTSGWKMDSAETDTHTAYPVLSSDTSVSALSIPVNFLNKENKYYGHLRNNTPSTSENQVVGINLSGTKGYYNKITMQYWKPNEAIASSINKAELFAVGNEAVFSSQ